MISTASRLLLVGLVFAGATALGMFGKSTGTDTTIEVGLQEHELSEHAEWWSIAIKYPAVEGADSFNAAVRQHVKATADGFKRALPKTASKDYPDYGAYLKGTYTARFVRNGILTV